MGLNAKKIDNFCESDASKLNQLKLFHVRACRMLLESTLAATSQETPATSASDSSDKGVQVDTTMECQQVEMQARLVDAEALVKRLRQENGEQRKELVQLKQQVAAAAAVTTAATSSSSRSNGRSAPAQQSNSNYYPNTTAPIAIEPKSQLPDDQQQQQSFQKFPPLQTQSYWHRAPRSNHGG